MLDPRFDLAIPAPFPAADLSAAEWDTLRIALVTRSGGCCEARTPACIAGPGGYLGCLPATQRSAHHRLPRKMGGTRRTGIHSLANLVPVYGSGTTGCHGYIESHPEWAFRTGWRVREGSNPADTPLTLHSGRRVLLDPLNAVEPSTIGWDLTDWPAANNTPAA
jgi:hypothetical protein